MDSPGILIPILVPIACFAMIFGIVYLNNKEKMAMIERGMDPRLNKSAPGPQRYLKWAFLLMGSGFGLFLANILHRFLYSNSVDDKDPALYFSLIALFGGLGLFISFLIEKKQSVDIE